MVIALSITERVRVRKDTSRLANVCACSPSKSLRSLKFRLRVTQSDPYCLDNLAITCLKSFATRRVNLLALFLAFALIASIVDQIIGFALPTLVSKPLASAIGLLVGALAVLPEVLKYYGFTKVKLSRLRDYFRMLTATDNLCWESYSLTKEIMSKLIRVKEGRLYTSINGEEILKELRSKYSVVIDLSLKKSLR